MVVTGDIQEEVEVFGVTYERYALGKLFHRLVRRFQIKTALEYPASGAKAMPSLYSLGLALSGCEVTLVDPDPDGLQIWRRLRLSDYLSTLSSEEVEARIESGERWDLCWNFMVLPTQEHPEEYARRMMRAARWLMLVHVNRFNVGFGMHRTVHRLWKIPWTHGDLRFFSPFRTAEFLRGLETRSLTWDVVDCPPWPDSPGFRDLRLHRWGSRPHRWLSPYADYLSENRFPSWMKWVYIGERLPLPRWLKLPYAHLFYIIAEVHRETD